MSKRTAILFVFLSSILYLAHAVIPHHQHQDHMCFDLAHSMHHNNTSGCKQNNDKEDNESPVEYNCVIDQGIILPSKQMNLESHYQFISSHLHNFHSIYAFLEDKGNGIHDLQENIINRFPHSECFSSPLRKGPVGLRAPPVLSIV